jgi:hypothetical protein
VGAVIREHGKADQAGEPERKNKNRNAKNPGTVLKIRSLSPLEVTSTSHSRAGGGFGELIPFHCFKSLITVNNP